MTIDICFYEISNDKFYETFSLARLIRLCKKAIYGFGCVYFSNYSILYALINYPLYEINGAFDRFDFFNLICTLPNIVWEVYSIYVPIGGQGRKVLNKDSTLNMDKISTCTYLPKSKCLVYELYSDSYAFSTNETILYV